MNYFTIKSSFFLVSSNTYCDEFNKIDKFMSILEKSGIGKIIEKIESKDNKIGRKKFNPYNMFAMVLYCFAKFNG